MEPTVLTLLLQALFVLLAFAWRTVAQLRETGGTGFVAHRERGLQAKAAGLALTGGLLAVVVAALAGIVAQVQLVEEPLLRRLHGPAYDDYVARTGRFLPSRAGVAHE